MYQDFQNLFQNQRAVTTAATYKSTPVLAAASGAAGRGVDLMAAGNDPGLGEVVKIHTVVTEAFVGGTSVEFRLVEADVEALTTGLATLITTGAIATAALVAGYQPVAIQNIPRNLITKRYIGIDMVSLGTHSAGKVTSAIVWDMQTNDADFPAVTGF